MEKKLSQLYNQIDNVFKQVALKFPDEIKCKKGCCDCCYAAFDISLIEAYVLKKAFLRLGKKTRRYCLKRAKKAHELWLEATSSKNTDISKLRIPCPLLSRDNECLLYKLRPVNCRTYGIPTEIAGKGHVCSLSGFKAGITYPTVRLQIIQNELLNLSKEVSKTDFNKRITIADMILLKDLLRTTS